MGKLILLHVLNHPNCNLSSDVIDKEQIEDTVNEIWQTILSTNSNIKRTDPSTWINEFWPDKTTKGFLSPPSDMVLKHCWLNRQNPNIYQLFSLLLEKEELSVILDRYGVMRPTSNVKHVNGELIEHPEWKTEDSWFEN